MIKQSVQISQLFAVKPSRLTGHLGVRSWTTVAAQDAGAKRRTHRLLRREQRR